jgi:chromatin segregation and condensation protein Rec8/ScpA/Scc1 (kleisin family)
VAATVSTPVFEGPVDLLLQLVNSHQVELYDIPLAEVVDAFVAEVATWDSVDLQTLSEFLMVASVLIELKSRRLLPGPDDVDTDEELVGAFQRATAERPVPVVDLYHVTVDTVTVADTVAALSIRLPRLGSSTFRALTGHLRSRMEIIVSFLALLELCKQGRVSLDQGHTFGDLEVAWLGGDRDRVPVGPGLYDEYEG